MLIPLPLLANEPSGDIPNPVVDVTHSGGAFFRRMTSGPITIHYQRVAADSSIFLERLLASVLTPTVGAPDTDWLNYLEGLSMADGPVAEPQADTVRSLWESFKAVLPSLTPPAAGLLDGIYQMHWSAGSRSLTVDVAQDGRFDWTYSDDTTGDGDEDVADEGVLSTRLQEYLRRLPAG